MKETPAQGIGLGTALFLIFLTLKLTGLITWSWWWVTAPLWGGLALVIATVLGVVVAAAVAALFAALFFRIFKR